MVCEWFIRAGQFKNTSKRNLDKNSLVITKGIIDGGNNMNKDSNGKRLNSDMSSVTKMSPTPCESKEGL